MSESLGNFCSTTPIAPMTWSALKSWATPLYWAVPDTHSPENAQQATYLSTASPQTRLLADIRSGSPMSPVYRGRSPSVS